MPPAHGDLVDRFEVGPVVVGVRHSCIRRDMYELVGEGPLDTAVVARLCDGGVVRAATAAVVIVDVERVHRLTIAPGLGKVVVMPKLSTTRPQQRRAAEEVARRMAFH